MSSSRASFQDAPSAECPIPPCAQEVWHYVPLPKKKTCFTQARRSRCGQEDKVRYLKKNNETKSTTNKRPAAKEREFIIRK